MCKIWDQRYFEQQIKVLEEENSRLRQVVEELTPVQEVLVVLERYLSSRSTA